MHACCEKSKSQKPGFRTMACHDMTCHVTTWRSYFRWGRHRQRMAIPYFRWGRHRQLMAIPYFRWGRHRQLMVIPSQQGHSFENPRRPSSPGHARHQHTRGTPGFLWPHCFSYLPMPLLYPRRYFVANKIWVFAKCMHAAKSQNPRNQDFGPWHVMT